MSVNSFSCLQCFLNLSSCWPSCDRSLSCHLSCHLPCVRLTAQKAVLANAALCQWPPASSLRAITNRAEAGTCSEPPPRPGPGTLAPVPCPQQAEKPAWSPILPAWRPCLTPGHQMAGGAASSHPTSEFPTSSAKASDKPPGLPGGASEPVCCSYAPPLLLFLLAPQSGHMQWTAALPAPPTGLLTSQRHNRCFPLPPRPSARDAPTSGSRLLVDTYACHHHLCL